MQQIIGILCAHLVRLLKSNRNGSLVQFGKQKVGPAFDEEKENYLQLWSGRLP